MFKALASLPLLHKYLGDSGHMNRRQSCNAEDTACSEEGIRHDQVLSIRNVPNVVQAALRDADES